MSAARPLGQPADADPFGIYVHVPFCLRRCGYCDFNTYTADELGGSVRRDEFAEVLAAEVRYAAEALGADRRAVDTVFVGGGTPTLLGADGLAVVLDAVRSQFGLTPGAEVTTEANPDTVDGPLLDALLVAGYTRISIGMQSTAPHVLAVLERTHAPGAGQAAARAALAAGFAHVSLDLIYGTPGERDDDLRRSVEDAVATGIDHLSAYALVVEDGTALARRVRRGEVPAPDADVAADRYEIVDEVARAAGLSWYEVSNWARPQGACRHNLGYWHDDDWWGIGPGAHSHRGDQRWWNLKHPAAYAAQVAAGRSPEAGRETLTAGQRSLERIMLGLRLAEGLPLDAVAERARPAVDRAVADGLLVAPAWQADRLVLTDRGRLLADSVIRDLAVDLPVDR